MLFRNGGFEHGKSNDLVLQFQSREVLLICMGVLRLPLKNFIFDWSDAFSPSMYFIYVQKSEDTNFSGYF